jgi:hypothetical protein
MMTLLGLIGWLRGVFNDLDVGDQKGLIGRLRFWLTSPLDRTAVAAS